MAQLAWLRSTLSEVTLCLFSTGDLSSVDSLFSVAPLTSELQAQLSSVQVRIVISLFIGKYSHFSRGVLLGSTLTHSMYANNFDGNKVVNPLSHALSKSITAYIWWCFKSLLYFLLRLISKFMYSLMSIFPCLQLPTSITLLMAPSSTSSGWTSGDGGGWLNFFTSMAAASLRVTTARFVSANRTQMEATPASSQVKTVAQTYTHSPRVCMHSGQFYVTVSSKSKVTSLGPN